MQLILNDTYVNENYIREILNTEIKRESIFGNIGKMSPSITEVVYIHTETEVQVDEKVAMIEASINRTIRRQALSEMSMVAAPNVAFTECSIHLNNCMARISKQKLEEEQRMRNSTHFLIAYDRDEWNAKYTSVETMGARMNICLRPIEATRLDTEKMTIEYVRELIKKRGINRVLETCTTAKKNELTPLEYIMNTAKYDADLKKISVKKQVTNKEVLIETCKKNIIATIDYVILLFSITFQLVYNFVCRMVGANFDNKFIVEMASKAFR